MTAADLIAFVAVLAAVAGTIIAASIATKANDISAQSLDIAKSDQVKQPELRIAAASPYLGDDIDAKEVEIGSEKTIKVSPPIIDITLQNSGDAPALITKAKLDFDVLERVEACAVPGGGPESIEATYKFTVPASAPGAPYSMAKSVRYEVAANDYERFALTVGPAVSFDDVGPWIAVASLSLFVDGKSEPLTAGPFALIQAGGSGLWVDFNTAAKSWKVKPARSVNGYVCQMDATDRIQDLLARKNLLPSPEFVALGEAVLAHKNDPKPNHPSDDPALRKGDCLVFTAPAKPKLSDCTKALFKVLERIPYTDDTTLCAKVAGSDDHSVFDYPDMSDQYVLCTKKLYPK